MPRPKLQRRVGFEPTVNYFKPAGTRITEEVVLTLEEYEAIRLKDLLELDQATAAKKMSISQPTFNRILKAARKKVANALVSGKAIRVQGGNFMITRKKRGLGPGGTCTCQNCGHTTPKIRGQPCLKRKCPKCGSMMIRGE